jgi:hypothetical protein
MRSCFRSRSDGYPEWGILFRARGECNRSGEERLFTGLQ